MGKKITISSRQLTINTITNYLANPGKITLDKDSKIKIEDARKTIEKILESDEVVYGVNTGFGKFSETRISNKNVVELQKRLVLSHAAGVGGPMPKELVRLTMLLKINSLALGHSGCRLEIVQLLVEMLNRDVLPVIPRKGSVGASGDLAPLAHMALVMMGEGSAYTVKSRAENGQTEWQRVDGRTALESAGLKPVVFEAKEGLALLNGTQATTAYAIWALIQAKQLVKTADIVGAITLEALHGTLTAFAERIQAVRNHPGQKMVAENVRCIFIKSAIVASHKHSAHKVQDAYSLRCIPQVHGAVRDSIDFIENTLVREANGVTDNPLVFSKKDEVLSGGNFHAAPVAYVSDLLGIVLTDLSSFSERRIEHLLDSSMSELPPFLAKSGGLNSGFMIAHVTAASLVSENKVLSHPSSVDSIPTSANKEDHVSMGTFAARKAAEIIRNLETVLAIELICACQALDLRAPVKPAKATNAVLDLVRQRIPFTKDDRLMHKDINLAKNLIQSGLVITECEKYCGTLA